MGTCYEFAFSSEIWLATQRFHCFYPVGTLYTLPSCKDNNGLFFNQWLAVLTRHNLGVRVRAYHYYGEEMTIFWPYQAIRYDDVGVYHSPPTIEEVKNCTLPEWGPLAAEPVFVARGRRYPLTLGITSTNYAELYARFVPMFEHYDPPTVRQTECLEWRRANAVDSKNGRIHPTDENSQAIMWSLIEENGYKVEKLDLAADEVPVNRVMS